MTKSSIMCNRVLNTPLTVTVTWYWSSVSNKTKISFSILAKKTQSRFCLDNMPVPTIQMIAWIKKMSLYLKNQTESTAVVEWKKAWILRRDITHFIPAYLFIFMYFGNHQQLFSRYFAAVFIGVFRTLPNV